MRESTRRHYEEVKALPEPVPDPEPVGKVRVMVLGSGSKGNCILIAFGQHALMIDAGLSPEETCRRARSVGYPLTKLDGVLLTHWHRDHSKFVTRFCTDYACPLACSRATIVGLETQPSRYRNADPKEVLDELATDSPFEIFPIKIDHEEGSLAYHVRVNRKNIVIAHDLGAPNSTLLAAVRAADALLIESNHDVALVHACTNEGHTAELHAKILSLDRGHLSNAQAAEVVGHVNPERIRSVCALHLSSTHNTEEEAEREIRAGLPAGATPQIYIARQDSAVLIEVNGGTSTLELSLTEQFRRIDGQVDGLIKEQQFADRETAGRTIVLGRYLMEMQQLFEQKDPGTVIEGFEFFTHWLDRKADTYRFSKRMMYYYLDDAKRVIPLIGEEVAKNLPMGTCAELAKYAKVKGQIAPAILQFAQEHTAQEVKVHVAKILYPGHTGHFDGPEDSLTITAGRKSINHLKHLLDQARPYVNENASDAEVLEYALVGFIQDQEKTLLAEAEAVEAQISEAPNIPLPPNISLIDLLEDTTEDDTAKRTEDPA